MDKRKTSQLDNKKLNANNKNTSKNQRRKKAKQRRALKITLLTFFFALLFMVGYGSYYVISLLNDVDTDNISKSPEDLGISKETEEKLSEADKIINIALFGVDVRSKSETGRSDSIIILTVDREHKKIKMTSLMRDSYVAIEGRKNDKLTHAHAYGGGQLAIKTINQNFDLNIKDYVTVDFSGLTHIIDALGGITLDIASNEIPSLNHNMIEQGELINVTPKNITKEGRQRVNGMQAVAFARIRDTPGGDYKRTERQRIVLEAILQEVKSSSITKFPNLVKEMLPYVKTSLSSANILKLGTSVLTSGIGNIEQQRFPLDEDTKEGFIGSGWYIQFNKEATVEKLHNYIFKDIEPNADSQNAGTVNN